MRKTKNRLFLTLFLSLFALAASAFDFKDNEGKLCFRISEGNAIVTYFSMSETENATHYDESGTWDYIPSTVEHDGKTYNVVGIDDYAFAGCTSMSQLVVGEGVTWIGSYAFKGCNNLWHIYLPKSVGRIGDYAFKGCSAVTHIETAMTSLPKMANSSTVFEDVPAEAHFIVPEANEELFKSAAGWNKFAGSMPVSHKKAYLCNVESGLYLDFGRSQWGNRAVLSEVGAEIEAIRMADGHMLISTQVQDIANHYLHAYGLDGADIILKGAPYRIWVIEGEDGQFQLNTWKFYLSYRQEEKETPIEWIEDNGEKTMWKLVTKEERINQLTSADNVEKNASFLIDNPTFFIDLPNPWKGSSFFLNRNWDGDNINFIGGVWNSDFNVYQELTVPNGWYKLSAKTTYRAAATLAEVKALRDAGSEPHNARLYANDQSVEVQSIFNCVSNTKKGEGDEVGIDGVFLPQDGDAANIYFRDGLCPEQSVLVNVTDGKLRIGVKNESHVEFDWTAFDDFSLTYINKNVGDVNADGHVTISDAVALIDYCLSGKTENLDAAVCDVDGNGVIDQNDANAIVKLFLNGK